MSQPETLGIVDAGRWSGVAASMAEFLTHWLTDHTLSRIPRGTIAGAERFLHQVLEGAALNRHERLKPEIPVMAGISNWSIALDVLTRLPGHSPASEDVTVLMGRYLDSLRQIRSGERNREIEATARDLSSFFLELLKQGSRRRQSAFAQDETPLGYGGSVKSEPPIGAR